MGAAARATQIFLTCDVELTPGLHIRGVPLHENFALSIDGATAEGSFGLGYQLSRLAEHRLKGVFFVEALCAHVFGLDTLKRIVQPILAAGHEVQLHLHTEWLPFMARDPVKGQRGHDMSDLTVDAQQVLIELGADALESAGAPRPTAFRAGNFGANLDTVRAASRAGMRFDASYNADRNATRCRIDSPEKALHPLLLEGIVEIPMTVLEDRFGFIRQASVRSFCVSEASWILDKAIREGWPAVVWLWHSFELINRSARRSSPIMIERFDRLCASVAQRRGFLDASGFNQIPEAYLPCPAVKQAPPRSGVRITMERIVEQALDRALYD